MGSEGPHETERMSMCNWDQVLCYDDHYGKSVLFQLSIAHVFGTKFDRIISLLCWQQFDEGEPWTQGQGSHMK